ncbi:MAG TPA: hypothetical protein VE964_14550 [Myxococcales bacterium]|nr:hypothetical protein [Myxococcales bacterium]
MPAAAVLALLLAAGETVGWEAGVQTQGRARQEPTGDGRARYGEFGVRAQIGLSAQGPDGRAVLNYSPSVLFSQAISGPAEPGTAARQTGRLLLETRLDPATRLSWRTAAEWGLTDFSPLSGQLARPVVGQLPSERFVRTLGVETMFELTHAFSRRLRLAVAAGMERGGGLGHDAVAVLPIQIGPKANASLAWTVDPVDSISVLWSGSHARFSIDRTAVLSDLQAAWTRRASSQTVLDAAGGVVFVESSASDSPSVTGTYATASAGVAWNVPIAPERTVKASAHLRLLPGVDRFTALAIQTVRGEGSAELTEGRIRLGAAASEARVVSGVGEGADELRLEARSSWLAARGWSLEGGLGTAWTNQAPFVGWQIQAFLGVRWVAQGWF